jgi:hypothetical protein
MFLLLPPTISELLIVKLFPVVSKLILTLLFSAVPTPVMVLFIIKKLFVFVVILILFFAAIVVAFSSAASIVSKPIIKFAVSTTLSTKLISIVMLLDDSIEPSIFIVEDTEFSFDLMIISPLEVPELELFVLKTLEKS